MRWWTLAGARPSWPPPPGRRACSWPTPATSRAAADEMTAEQTLVSVEQRDLSQEEELDGTTGHGATPARSCSPGRAR